MNKSDKLKLGSLGFKVGTMEKGKSYQKDNVGKQMGWGHRIEKEH